MLSRLPSRRSPRPPRSGRKYFQSIHHHFFNMERNELRPFRKGEDAPDVTIPGSSRMPALHHPKAEIGDARCFSFHQSQEWKSLHGFGPGPGLERNFKASRNNGLRNMTLQTFLCNKSRSLRRSRKEVQSYRSNDPENNRSLYSY